MKKITLLTVVVALMSVACRQEEDVLTSQDIANLKIIQETRDLRKNNTQTPTNINTTSSQTLVAVKVDGETLPPPKK